LVVDFVAALVLRRRSLTGGLLLLLLRLRLRARRRGRARRGRRTGGLLLLLRLRLRTRRRRRVRRGRRRSLCGHRPRRLRLRRPRRVWPLRRDRPRRLRLCRLRLRTLPVWPLRRHGSRRLLLHARPLGALRRHDPRRLLRLHARSLRRDHSGRLLLWRRALRLDANHLPPPRRLYVHPLDGASLHLRDAGGRRPGVPAGAAVGDRALRGHGHAVRAPHL
jgi:hypothetical protein